ncbi:hypothetical protein HanIR_Chr04g0181551 [Helianthus annuus]|nr:hypothetical protein HanIR_Chr04g0181551 [Helianthus annuus]
MRFSHVCHFNPKLKLFEFGSLWFQFCCYFHPKAKSGHFSVNIQLFCLFPPF